jgi:uncharacterized protein YaaN involved in tellurite resistance
MTDTEAKITTLPPVKADAGQVAVIRSQIRLDDRAAITSFGDKAQRTVTEYSDRILRQTKNKELGETGELLTSIIAQARGLDPAALRKQGFFGRMFGNARAEIAKFKGKFETVASQVDGVTIELNKRKEGLRRDIMLLDDLHEETRASILALDAHIEAGKQFIVEYRAGELESLRAQAESMANTPEGLMAAQNYQDAAQALERLEKRVFYLQQARTIGIQQLPQIRIVQAGDETLIENLQATTQLTIPVWKQKMILLLGLSRQEDALALQKAVTDATNEMMKQASSMMKEQAIAIEQQAQRGIVDMETLELTNRDLIDTIQGVLQVQRDGRQKRAEAEVRMEQMTGELKRALAAAASAT